MRSAKCIIVADKNQLYQSQIKIYESFDNYVKIAEPQHKYNRKHNRTDMDLYKDKVT